MRSDLRRRRPRRRIRRRPSRLWLLLLLPALFLLTTPMPVPRHVVNALRGAPAVAQGRAVVPTARIELQPTATLPVSGAIIPPTAEPPTPLPTAPPPDPTAPPIEPSLTPLPPTATLSPPLLVVTPPTNALPVAIATLLPTLPAAPPVGAPVPAAPATGPVAGPVAPVGQPLFIPTLMYHYVRVVDAGSDPLGYNLSVTPQHLEEQLDWIAQRGYTTVTMNTLMRCLNGGSVDQPCPAQPIALTFDDGYDDAFTAALPALQRRGMVATFYIISSVVGQPAYMTWDQIRALQSAGMEIGGHTVSHLDLTTLGWDQARSEIADSKTVIEQQIGRPVNSFCYPSGRFNNDVVALVQQSGYTNATTTMPDLPQSNPFLLPRLRVEGSYELGQFQGLVP